MMVRLGACGKAWINLVAELGDTAKADAYRDHMFKLLWRGASSLEEPSNGALPRQCLEGRVMALAYLAAKEKDWDADTYVSHVHRAGVFLERLSAGSECSIRGGDSCGGLRAEDLARFYGQCHEVLRIRLGERWPMVDRNKLDGRTVDGDTGRGGCSLRGAEDQGDEKALHVGRVDWLQHYAGVLERASNYENAQVLIQLTYEYVRPFTGQGVLLEWESIPTVYLGILKLHAASVKTSQQFNSHPTPRSVGSTPSSKQGKAHSGTKLLASKPRVSGKNGATQPQPVSKVATEVHHNLSLGLEYLQPVCDSLPKASTDARRGVGINKREKNEGGHGVVATGLAVKLWKWLRKACGTVTLWVEELGRTDLVKLGTGQPGLDEWRQLHVRSLILLADLSRGLVVVRVAEDAEGGRNRVPPSLPLPDVAVDSYLKGAHLSTALLAGVDACVVVRGRDGSQCGGSQSRGSSKSRGSSLSSKESEHETQALVALRGAEELYGVLGDKTPGAHARRIGVGWFNLGKTLLDTDQTDRALIGLTQGCRLLEEWALKEESDTGCSASSSGSHRRDIGNHLRSIQLDLRLSVLSRALQVCGEAKASVVAAARAVSFCADFWCHPSADRGCVPTPSSAGTHSLVKRFVACKLRAVTASVNVGTQSHRSVAVNDTIRYLTDGHGLLPSDEETVSVVPALDLAENLKLRHREGLPTEAVVALLLEESRAYNFHLQLYIGQRPGRMPSGRESQGTGESRSGEGAVAMCVLGHRRCTAALLEMCALEWGGDVGDTTERDGYEVNVLLLWTGVLIRAAQLEHDLFFHDVGAVARGIGKEEGADDSKVLLGLSSGRSQHGGESINIHANLTGAMEDTLMAEEIMAKVRGDSSPEIVAAAGVCACTRALLLRDLFERCDDDREKGEGEGHGSLNAMDEGLDLLDKAIREAGWRPGIGSGLSHDTMASSTSRIGEPWPMFVDVILGSLEVLESHYALHGDMLRQVQVGKLRVLVLGRRLSSWVGVSRAEAGESLQDVIALVSALGGIGTAYHVAALPSLSHSYRDAAIEKLCGNMCEQMGECPGDGSSGDFTVVKISVDILHGLCLAEEWGGVSRAETALLDAQRTARALGGGGKLQLENRGMGVHLECVVGMALSWLFEMQGRLVEAMGELRQVLSLCHLWASTGVSLGPDRWMVSLSKRAETVFDEEEKSFRNDEEEGVGRESSKVDECEEGDRVGQGQQEEKEGQGPTRGKGQSKFVTMNSRWLSLYLEGLVHMGRLWRMRGFARKSGGYLRQSCIVAEQVHSAHLLRSCLLEEVELSTQMHNFDRAERLLRVCETLLTSGVGGGGVGKGPPSVASGSGASLVGAQTVRTRGCPRCSCGDSQHPKELAVEQVIATKARTEPIGNTNSATHGNGAKTSLQSLGGEHSRFPLMLAVIGGGACTLYLCCWEQLLSEAEVLVVEVDLLRRRGDFRGALAACVSGEAALAPLVEATGAMLYPTAATPPLGKGGHIVEHCDSHCVVGSAPLEAVEGVSSGRGQWIVSVGGVRAAEGDRATEIQEGKEGEPVFGWRACALLARLRWRHGRLLSLIGAPSSDAEELYRSCMTLEGASALDRAMAAYHLGHAKLDAGNVLGAQGLLEMAECLVSAAGTPSLVRMVRRALAVALIDRGSLKTVEGVVGAVGGRKTAKAGISVSWQVASLVSLSIGIMHCNQVFSKVAKSWGGQCSHQNIKSCGECNDHSDHGAHDRVPAGLRLFQSFGEGGGVVTGDRVDVAIPDHTKGTPQQKEAAYLEEAVQSKLPSEWTVISMCLTAAAEGVTTGGIHSSRQLLVTRLRYGHKPLTLSVPLGEGGDTFLERWRGIMEENQATLRGHGAKEAATWNNRQKAGWWDRRAAVDEAVRDLLEEMEQCWLNSQGLAAVLLGGVVDEGLRMRLDNACKIVVQKISEAASSVPVAGTSIKKGKWSGGGGAGVTASRRGKNGKGRGKSRGKKASGAGQTVVPGSDDTTVPYVTTAVPVEDGEVVGVESAAAAVIIELVHISVHGGNLMDEMGWRRVVRLAGVLLSTNEEEALVKDICAVVASAFAPVARGSSNGSASTSTVGCGRVDGMQRSAWKKSATDLSPVSRRGIEVETSRSTRGETDVNGGEDPGGSPSDLTPLPQISLALASPITAAKTVVESRIDRASLSKLKVAELRAELSSRGLSLTGLRKKADLLGRLEEALQLEGVMVGQQNPEGRGEFVEATCSMKDQAAENLKHGWHQGNSPVAATLGDRGVNWKDLGDDGVAKGETEPTLLYPDRHPVLLVLDEELQAIPWEGLPSLQEHPVTRLPALPFVFSALDTAWRANTNGASSSQDPDWGGIGGRGGCRGRWRTTTNATAADRTTGDEKGTEACWLPARNGIRLNRAFYVLDPEDNLPRTRTLLEPTFSALEHRLGWAGITGQASVGLDIGPLIKRSLAEDADLFVYCGHGAGELLVDREAVAGLPRCAAAILMGCSSGRLKGYGEFEPSGMVSGYLVGGSPAVVSNLWDVTDKDIDRFSMALLEFFVGKGSEPVEGRNASRSSRAPTLSHAVAWARRECKMKHIVGLAPVCYGIPLAAAPDSFHPG
ncbi:unnamed protein product [Choristocarpus tenellus]